MKYAKMSLLVALVISLFFIVNNQVKKTTLLKQKEAPLSVADPIPTIPIQPKAIKAKEFCEVNELNTNICILIDMSLHSGKNRLFVYDFKKDSVISSALCAHGCCNNEWAADNTKTTPEFNNIPDSHCSSLGKYKIGNRGYSNWGINVNYRLHGLEYANNNAYSRDIVLHSWGMITNHETFPEGTPEGWGCPALSNQQMRKLDSILQTETKPLLMWIYKN